MGIAVLVGSMTYFSKGDLQLLSVLSACVAAHACFFNPAAKHQPPAHAKQT